MKNKRKIITVTRYTNDIAKVALAADLILLDLDDVVMAAEQYSCGSIWYGRHHANNKAKSPHKLIHDLYHCLNTTSYKPVSKELIEDFSKLAQQKTVLGFTARTIDFSDTTFMQLNSVGMRFSDFNSSHVLIKSGVIFAGYDAVTAKSNNKGNLLQTLIEQGLFGSVKNILMIDDFLKNLISVEEELSTEIAFRGIHYTEVRAKLYCDFESRELDILEKHQLYSLKNNGYLPANHEVMGGSLAICPSD